jgi:hypothetical protein
MRADEVTVLSPTDTTAYSDAGRTGLASLSASASLTYYWGLSIDIGGPYLFSTDDERAKEQRTKHPFTQAQHVLRMDVDFEHRPQSSTGVRSRPRRLRKRGRPHLLGCQR